MKVYFVGAGPGDIELITIKAEKLIKLADYIIYPGSLINKEILTLAKSDALLFDSAPLTLFEIINIICEGIKNNKLVVRLTSGDPSIYGAILEQMLELDKRDISYEIVPGISSLFAAAAHLKTELTAPLVSQSIIITRMEGRTKKPNGEEIEKISLIKGTHCYFLSIDKINNIVDCYIKNQWPPSTPVAVIYNVTNKDEKIIIEKLDNIANKISQYNIKNKALIIIGDVLSRKLKNYSKLYDRSFFHGYRPE
jgi:precorrin-4/cobalt-precorrin-4 C11-methyltransferase